MRYLVLPAILLFAVSAFAQTTVDITAPAGLCSYSTGPVTTGAPGHLVATATSSTGPGCGSSGGNVSFGPASPLTPSSQQTGNSQSGNSASVAFQAVNATSCIAAITGAAGGTFTSGVVSGTGTASATVCNSGASCQAVQNVGMSFPYNSNPSTDNVYTVSATCTGTGGNANSTATVTVPHGTVVGGSCITVPSSTTGIANFTQWTGNKSITYSNGVQTSVNVASFDSVYKKPWPGTYNIIPYFNLPVSNYVSLQFTVPSGFFSGARAPSPLTGDYTIGSSAYSAPISMTISTSCGDFANPATNPSSTVVSGCFTNKAGSGGIAQWRSNNRCILSDQATYYLNIINADISAVTPATGGVAGGTAASTKNAQCSTTCSDPVENGIGTWSGWTGTSWP